MRKSSILCGLCVALVLASCGSSKESAYKKMYLKAQAKQEANKGDSAASDDAPVVTPLVEKPADQTTVVDNVDNASVRTEDFTLVDGAGLKNFSVVVGAFSVKANAMDMQSRLKQAGYGAQVVLNTSRNLYRVVATTFDNKADAVQSRNQLRATYNDAWILYKK